jgi:drug/metabolite transporter (DMT)-like permease
MTHRAEPSRALVVVVFAILTGIWGTTWAAIRVGLQGIPPFTGVALRFLIAGAALFAVSAALKVRYQGSPREWLIWLVNGTLSFCVSYGVVYWSEQWVPSGLSSVLFATFPLFVAVIAHFLLPGERLGARSVGGVLVGFLGVAVIFSEDFALLGGSRVALASTVFLISPAASAVAAVVIKRWGGGIHPVSISAVPMAMSAFVMGGLALATERHAPLVFDVRSGGALTYLALFGSALTFSLYYWLMGHLRATRLSLIAYTTPVIAVLFGAAFMDETLTHRMMAGSVLVVGGVAMAVGRARAEDAPSPAVPPGEP